MPIDGIQFTMSWPTLIGLGTLVAAAWGLHSKYSNRTTRLMTLLDEHIKAVTESNNRNHDDHVKLFDLVQQVEDQISHNANQIGQLAQLQKVTFAN